MMLGMLVQAMLQAGVGPMLLGMLVQAMLQAGMGPMMLGMLVLAMLHNVLNNRLHAVHTGSLAMLLVALAFSDVPLGVCYT